MKALRAVLASDIHACTHAPTFRSKEPDWFEAMGRQFDELESLLVGDVPLIVAGDVFDKWDPPPELINFMIDRFPQCWAVPGQHDLPNHRYDDIKRSAYWTLVEAGKIRNIDPQATVRISENVFCHGFPWKYTIKPFDRIAKGSFLHVAVIHSYIWVPGCGYPGASTQKLADSYVADLEGYDISVFGDNHKGFFLPQQKILNCGTFFVRKSDEKGYRPRVGLLYEDGSVELRYLESVRHDVYLEKEEEPEIIEASRTEARKVIDELKALGSDKLDFREAVLRYLEKSDATSDVRAFVLGAID